MHGYALSDANIKIEKFTHVASHVFIAGHNGFKLGKFCGLGAGTKIYTSSEDYTGEGICNLNLSQKNIALRIKSNQIKILF